MKNQRIFNAFIDLLKSVPIAFLLCVTAFFQSNAELVMVPGCPAGQYYAEPEDVTECGGYAYCCKPCPADYVCPGGGEKKSDAPNCAITGYLYREYPSSQNQNLDAKDGDGIYSCYDENSWLNACGAVDPAAEWNSSTSSSTNLGWNKWPVYGYPEFACSETHSSPTIDTQCPAANRVLRAAIDDTGDNANTFNKCYLIFKDTTEDHSGEYLSGTINFSVAGGYAGTRNVQLKTCDAGYYCPAYNVSFGSIFNAYDKLYMWYENVSSNPAAIAVGQSVRSDDNYTEFVLSSFSTNTYSAKFATYIGRLQCPTYFPHSDSGADAATDCYATVTFYMDDTLATTYTTKNKNWDGNAATNTYTLGADMPTNPTKSGSAFDGWYRSDNNTRVDANTVLPGGDISLYAKWTEGVSPINITYLDPEDDSVIYQTTTAEGGMEKQLPTKNGYIFTGWCKSTNYNTTTGACSSIVGPQTTGNKTVVRWVIPNDVAVDTTYYALYQEDKFQIHTTKINTVPSGTAASAATDYYAFGLTASGKYYVDWGDGVVEIINRSDTTPRTYSHTYSDADRTYTIHFGGFGSIGSSYFNYSAARFCGNVNIDGRSDTIVSVNENVTINNTINQEKVESLTGSLGAIFSGSPNFNGTFWSCKNLTSIPDTLFGRVIKDANDNDVYQGVSGSVAGMFNETFHCSPKLASIPENLFGRVIKDANGNNVYRGVSGSASNMFRNTFESWGNGCWNQYITSIPENLFGRVIKDANNNDVYVGVSGNAKWLFLGTFSGLGRLASIPENLFGRVVNGQYYGVSGAAEGMFGSTFRATGITEIPEKLFSRAIKDANDNDVYVGVSGAAESMFASTFAESRLTSIPEDLFIGVTGKANYMFSSTFSSTNITSIPENLFGRVIDGQYRGVTDSANGMFASTFNRCRRFETIPEKLFGRVIDGQYYGVSGHAPSLFQNTFQACDKLRSIPENLFMGVSGSAASMFEGTFMNCPWLSSIPEKLFGRTVDGEYVGVSGAAERMFADTFNGCVWLRGVPETLFAGISGDINSATGMFDHTFSNAFDSYDEVEPVVYIPAGLFAGINLASYQSGPMNGIFENAPLLATDCGNMEEVSPNYLKVDWFKDGECTDINNPSCEFVVACVPLQAHTITYNTNGGTMSGDNITMVTENQKYTQEYNSAITLPSTTKQDFIFAGWCLDEISENEVMCPADRRLSAITADNIDDITLYATWTAPKFEITTTSDTDQFGFAITAAGVFYVDWGDGTGEIIDRTNDTTDQQYFHNYELTDSYTVKIGGRATQYADVDIENNLMSTVVFGSNITEITGSVGSVFPTLNNGANNTDNPRFVQTFVGAEQLASIPANLFDGVTNPADGMFYGTFYGCSGLTEIPANLFANISGNAKYLFGSTFGECSNLTTVPEDLFGRVVSGEYHGITGAAYGMFNGTFVGCSRLATISANLFGRIVNGQYYGVSGAEMGMFGATFYATGLTEIPDNLFMGITEIAPDMFMETFGGNSNLTRLPNSLFPNLTADLTSASADSMFGAMFMECPSLTGYVPKSLIENLGVTGYDTATWPNASPMMSMFNGNTNMLTECPEGMSEYKTPLRKDWCTASDDNCPEYVEDTTTDYAISCVPAVYDIKYNLDGGTNNSDNPDTYVMSDEAITLAKPIKSDFAFGGWYDNADFDGDAVTEIPAGSYGDKEFWAKWEEVSTYVVYFDANATDADGTKGEQTCDYGQPCTITNNDEITRMDYNFVGWVDASGTEYTGDTMTHTEPLENDEITLYAMWEPICRSGKRLHIDDQSMCLYEKKRTDIALAFWLDGEKYYLNMCNASECDNSMTMGTNKKLHLLYGEDVYNVYDLTAE